MKPIVLSVAVALRQVFVSTILGSSNALLCSYIALAVLFASPQASADILQATLTGTYAGGVLGFCVPCGVVPYSSFVGNSFIAGFTFDTSTGTLSSPSAGVFEVTDGAASASVSVTGMGGSGTGTIVNPSNVIEWQTDGSGNLTLLRALVIWDGGFGSLSFGNLEKDSFQGSGPCPGQPCGLLNYTSVNMVDLSAPVPGPTVGTGASSFALAALFLGWLARRRGHHGVSCASSQLQRLMDKKPGATARAAQIVPSITDAFTGVVFRLCLPGISTVD